MNVHSAPRSATTKDALCTFTKAILLHSCSMHVLGYKSLTRTCHGIRRCNGYARVRHVSGACGASNIHSTVPRSHAQPVAKACALDTCTGTHDAVATLSAPLAPECAACVPTHCNAVKSICTICTVCSSPGCYSPSPAPSIGAALYDEQGTTLCLHAPRLCTHPLTRCNSASQAANPHGASPFPRSARLPRSHNYPLPVALCVWCNPTNTASTSVCRRYNALQAWFTLHMQH